MLDQLDPWCDPDLLLTRQKSSFWPVDEKLPAQEGHRSNDCQAAQTYGVAEVAWARRGSDFEVFGEHLVSSENFAVE